MRRIVALAMVIAMSSASTLLAAARAGRAGQTQTASVTGTATSSTGQVIPNVTVQLRNLATGQLAGTTTSNAGGAFSFAGLPAGSFSVEVVSASGQIIGTSAAISVAAGATITGVTVTASAALLGAAAGVAAGAAAGTAGISTAVVIATVAAAAGVAGAVAVASGGTASPSR